MDASYSDRERDCDSDIDEMKDINNDTNQTNLIEVEVELNTRKIASIAKLKKGKRVMLNFWECSSDYVTEFFCLILSF